MGEPNKNETNAWVANSQQKPSSGTAATAKPEQKFLCVCVLMYS